MKYFTLTLIFLSLGCSSSKKISDSDVGSGDTRTIPVEYLNNTTFILTESTDDKTYGFDQKNPVKVGGLTTDGVINERRFLNALVGLNGEEVRYQRGGSCCSFKTPNGLIGNGGLLDVYRVYKVGTKDTLNIYINLYDTGDLKIPVGFKAKQK